MRKEKFEENEYYHIYNRGVDKRSIVMDDYDKIRFIHTLYILNSFLNIPYRFNIVALRPQEFLTPRQPFVKIVAACLMPNHYHLMLTPLKENGVSDFLQKIGTSYTKYFNSRHNRTGRLFERTFQAKLINKQEYASYLTYYIHLNPLKLCTTTNDPKKKLEWTMGYEWSTLPDYLEKKGRFSKITTKDFRDDILDMNVKEYKDFINNTYKGLMQA